jgi:hypothetical protein
VVVFLQVFERAPRRVGARVALSEEAFAAAVSLGGAGSLAVGAWLMVERGAPPRRIAQRSAVLFLYTSAINVITLILAGMGLFLGLPGPSNPLLSVVPAAVGILVLGVRSGRRSGGSRLIATGRTTALGIAQALREPFRGASPAVDET